jgi:dTDP-4-amino-4,6-dideoxygalactose transaminase
MRSHGMTSMSWDRYRGRARSYEVSRHGFNYRLDEIRAALGRAQLAKLPRHNARRRALLHAYRRYLAGNTWAIPFAAEIERSGAHLMVAVAPEAATRERAIAALSDARIQSSLHYPCIADFAAFAGMRAGDLARSRDFQARALTLPLYPTMTEDDVARVCAVLALA